MTEAPAAETSDARPVAPKPRGGAVLVAAGILLSRLAGLIRTRALSHYLGTSAAADAYTGALRIPNVLQNLLGEGVLSASFIPVYAALRTQGTPEAEQKARKVAGAVAGLLGVAVGLLSLLGIAATPWLIDLITPGFQGDTRALAIRLVQIFFPGVGLLVLSAFCLGVLNSHRRFFLSYAAPVLWNAAIVAALIAGGVQLRLGPFPLAVAAAWGMVAGSALQLAVQLPSVLRLLGGPRAFFASLGFGRGDANVRQVLASFGPVLLGRGVVNLSAYIDTFLASWLPVGAVAAMSYAQILYLLPVSVFGMAISAAALPAMSEQHGQDDQARAEALRAQIARGLGQVAFPVVPCAVAFLVVGDVISAALFQSGRFGASDARYVWGILAGSSIGLLAQASGRLYSSAFYALRDTQTPLRCAAIRVSVAAAIGAAAALWLPARLGLHPRWGAALLTATSGLSAWLELGLLARGLRARIGAVGGVGAVQARLWLAAGVAGAAALGAKAGLLHAPAAVRGPWPMAIGVLGVFGVVYLGLVLGLGVPQATEAVARVRRRVLRR